MSKGKRALLTGLWVQRPEDGESHMSGTALEDVTIPAGTKFRVYKNDKRGDEKRPDYKRVIYAESEEREVNAALVGQDRNPQSQELPF